MDNKKQQSIEEKSPNKTSNKVSKKFKIISALVLSLELLYMFRGPKLYGLLLFMITASAILILLDKDKSSKSQDSDEEKDEIFLIKKSINKEIELIKKSTKKLNYNLTSSTKLDNILKHLESLSEKYFFIKENYGEKRGMETLSEIINQLKNLENNLKEINDKLLNFYVKNDEKENLNEDLDYIIDQLDAQKVLNSKE